MTEHLQTQSVSGVDMLANKDPKLLLSIFLYKQWVTWILVCESGSFIARNSGSQVRFKNLLKHLFNFIILVFSSFCRWKDLEQRFCQFVGLEYSGVLQSSQEWTSQQAHLKFRPCGGQRNWLKTPRFHLRLHRPQLLKFKSVQLEEHRTGMDCLKGLPGEQHFIPKRPWQHGLVLESCIWGKKKTDF